MATSTPTLEEFLNREVVTLSSVRQNLVAAIDLQMRSVIDQATQIVEQREHFTDAAAKQLLDKCEESMRHILKAEHEHRSQHEVMQALPNNLPAEATPKQVHELFKAGMAQKGVGKERAADDELFTKAPRMIELRRVIEGMAGGPSGPETGMGEDEDIMMTQATRTNFKCPLLQCDMTMAGEMRPMKSVACNKVGCVWSHKGIFAYLGKKRKACPSTGCDTTIVTADLAEDKELVKEIRRIYRERG